jgi:hypothetical protein
MKLWTCQCRWRYVITKRNVYGPIIPDMDTARIMSRKEWKEQYGDCEFRYRVEMQRNG